MTKDPICGMTVDEAKALRAELNLKEGLTALVGENDAGKTAVVDALRFALGTTDQEWFRLEDTDFHRSEGTAREIRITCEFHGLNPVDKRAFIEYLTYGESVNDEPYLCVTWTASDSGTSIRGRPFRRVEVHSGKDGQGPIIALEVRELLRATYLSRCPKAFGPFAERHRRRG